MTKPNPNGATVAMEVIRFLTDHPGEYFHYRKIAEEIGADPSTVSAYLNKQARLKPQLGISREPNKVGRGSGNYRFDPPQAPARLPAVISPAPAPAAQPAPAVNGHTAARPGDLFEYAGHIDGTGVVRHPVTWELYRLERITS